MDMKDAAAEMLRAYSDLKPEQQLEVLIRVWPREDPSEKGKGKAILLAILMFEAFGVPVSNIRPENVEEAVSVLRRMAEQIQNRPKPDLN